MAFLSPLGLLGLLVVPVLVALSLWRRRRREVVTSSLLLWRQVAEARRPMPAAQRRRRTDPLLVLRIAVALALTGALSGLALVRTETQGRRFVLVLDRSASMGALRPDGSTRFRAGKDAWLKLSRGMGPGDELRTVRVPRFIRQRRTADTAAFTTGIVLLDDWTTDVPVEPNQFLAVVRDEAGRWPDAHIIAVTDQEAQDLPSNASVIATGGPADNRGIVAFAARRRRDGRHEVLVRVANAGEKAANVRIRLLADDRSLGDHTLLVSARGQAHTIFEADLTAVRVLHATLAGSDALAADDRAWLARRVGPIRVALVGDPSIPLRRALAAVGDVEVVQFAEPPDAGVPQGCTLAVYYHAVPRTLTGGTIAVVAPGAAVGQLQVAQEKEQAKLTSVERRDPLMKAVELDGVKLGAVRKVAAPAGFEALARAGEVPLIGRWREAETTVIYVGIDPAPSECDWALKASFPIFWANVGEAAAGGRRGEFSSVRPGELCRLPDMKEPVTVRGAGIEPFPVAGGVFRPERVGLYRAKAQDGREIPVAVSLLSEHETMEAGSGVTILPKALPSATVAAAAVVRRLDGWLALLGLLLVLAHGWATAKAKREA